MIGEAVSHYRITRLLGAGGMGMVYEAVDTALDRPVALKFLPPQALADPAARVRFVNEAQAASALDHPNVCTVYEIGETEDGSLFLAMAYYRGETVADRIARGPLPVAEAVDIARQMAAGLAKAHEQGIVHRDIKPANVFLTDDGLVKILDFGLAKLSGGAQVTQTGQIPGTAAYMSPEQARGDAVDHRTDLWSLGAVLHEMLTGQRAFPAEYEQAVIYAILNEEPLPPSDLRKEVPAALDRVVALCLAKDPERRIRSAADLVKALHGAAPPAFRHRLRLAALVVLAAVLAGVVVQWNGRSDGIHTTKLRVAVLPLTNLAHKARDPAVAGMGTVVYRMLDEASRVRPSMWVVRDEVVAYAPPTKDELARTAFGVNRLVTGTLQRYGGGQMLHLALRDARSLATLREVMVPYAPPTAAFADSLPGALLHLLDLPPGSRDRLAACLPAVGPAVVPYLEGLGLLDGDDPDGAEARFEAVTTAVPDWSAGWCGLAAARVLAFAATGADSLRAEAEADLAHATDLAPDRWRSWFALGELRRTTGDSTGALAAYREADALDPGNPVVCRGLSRIYIGQQRLAEAENALVSAVTRWPDSPDPARILARYYYGQGEAAACLVQLDRVLALAPDEVSALNMKGAVLFSETRYPEAQACFERSFALGPNIDNCSNIGLMLIHQGKYGEAAEFYELALEYGGKDNHENWANVARALYWSDGGRERAVTILRKAIALADQDRQEAPADAALLCDLVEYHAMAGDREDVVRLAAVADSLGGADARLHYKLGDAYELIGDRTAALRHLADAVRYGMPIREVQDTRDLRDLVKDPRFARIASTVAGDRAAAKDSVR